MAVGESAGTVFVTIDGDASPLMAKYAAVAAASQAAGQRVGASFIAGGQAAGQASGLVDQYGRAIESAATAQTVLAPATERATEAIVRQNAAMHGSVTQIQAVSGTLRTLEGNQGIRAAERFLTMLPGLGAALQYAFPVVGAIALAEVLVRLTDRVIGLKEATESLTAATHSADEAWANFEHTADSFTVSHITEEFGRARGLSAQGTLDKNALKRDQEALDEVTDHIKILQEAQAKSTGTGLAMIAQLSHIPLIAGAGRDALKVQADHVKELQAQAREIQASIAKDEARIGRSGEQGKIAGAEESGQVSGARIANEEKALDHQKALNKAYSDAAIALSHATVEQQIAAMHDRDAAAIATAAEELRVAQEKEAAITADHAANTTKRIALIRAKDAAEAAGKSGPEQAVIGERTRGKVSDYQQQVDEETLKAAVETQSARARLGTLEVAQEREWADAVSKAWQEAAEKKFDALQKGNAQNPEVIAMLREAERHQGEVKASEVSDKVAGEVRALAIKQQEIALEAQYDGQLIKTGEDRVRYLERIAELEAQATEEKIKGLEAEKKDAESIANEEERLVKIAEIQGRIDVERAQGAVQQTKAQSGIAQAQRENNTGRQIAQQVAQAIQTTLPQTLGTALSRAFLSQHKGESDSKVIVQAIKGLGQQLAGQVLGTIFHRLIEEIIVQTGLQAALNALFPVVAAAQTAILISAQATIATAQTVALITAMTANTQEIVAALVLAFFADGTDSAPGGLAMVGEKGPEIINLPRGSQVIPNHAIKKYADGTPGWKSATHYQSTAFQTGTTNLTFHAHGIQNPDKFIDHVMRKLPETLKRRSPNFSPLSR